MLFFWHVLWPALWECNGGGGWGVGVGVGGITDIAYDGEAVYLPINRLDIAVTGRFKQKKIFTSFPPSLFIVMNCGIGHNI